MKRSVCLPAVKSAVLLLQSVVCAEVLKMPSYSNISEFRLIFNRVKNIGAKFESSSQGELGGDVKELSENVRILDGNLSAFSDEVFSALAHRRSPSEQL